VHCKKTKLLYVLNDDRQGLKQEQSISMYTRADPEVVSGADHGLVAESSAGSKGCSVWWRF